MLQLWKNVLTVQLFRETGHLGEPFSAMTTASYGFKRSCAVVGRWGRGGWGRKPKDWHNLGKTLTVIKNTSYESGRK